MMPKDRKKFRWVRPGTKPKSRWTRPRPKTPSGRSVNGGGSFQCDSRKLAYSSRKEAIRGCHDMVRDPKFTPRKPYLNVYRCEICGYWHIGGSFYSDANTVYGPSDFEGRGV